MYSYFIMLFFKILNLAIIALLIVFLLYIRDLEKENCSCSENWKRDYIKYFTLILVLLNVSSLFISNVKHKLFGRFRFIFGILAIVNIIAIILWVNKLEEEKCKCSKGWERGTMKIYAHIQLFLILFVFLMFAMITAQGAAAALPPSKRHKLTKKQIQAIRKIIKKKN